LLVNEIKNEILINELQLGEQLNECVHENKRSDFSLLLAMLTDDVRAHAQFSLPETTEEPPKSDEASLRKLYQLPNAQALSLEALDNIDCYNQADLVNENKLIDLHLANALTPNPLAFRNNSKHIAQQVLDNTSLYCQKKYEKESQGHAVTNERLNFNAEQWLNTISEEVLKESVAIGV